MRQMNLEFKKSAPGSHSRNGFTLVEVMVAMAIFIFGAMAILRIFPAGLTIVRDTEDRATATRLSRNTTNSFESKIAYAPDAVYNYAPASTFNGGWAEAINTANVPLTYTGGIANSSLPNGPQDNVLETALGQFKAIRGERQSVRSGVLDAGGGSVPFVLARYPYNGGVNVFIEETILDVTIRADGHLDFSNARMASTGASFNDTSIPPAVTTAFPVNPPVPPKDSWRAPGTNSVFYVSYRWREDRVSGGTGTAYIQGVQDEPLTMPDDAGWTNTSFGRVIPTRGGSSNNVLPGPVTVRVRRQLGTVAPSAAPIASVSEEHVGLVRLTNPFNTTANPHNTDVLPATTIWLDYVVADWGAMVHDQTPQAPSDFDLPPTAPFRLFDSPLPVQGIDTEQGVTSLFIMPSASVPVNTPNIQWSRWDGNASAQNANSKIRDVIGTSGRITFETAANTHTRTIYRTLDGWAHQLAVAARAYEEYIPAGRPTTSTREPWREYVWLAGANPDGGRLYFQASEAGKAVMVTYEYLDGTTPRLMPNVIVPIGEEVVDVTAIGGLPAGFASRAVSMAQLTDLYGNSLGNTVVAIRSVQGVSTMARTAWLRGSRYSQVVAKGMRPLVQ